jgi:hypothetical protein
MTSPRVEIHPALRLWLPLALFIGLAAAHPFLGPEENLRIYAENGVLELMQPAIALASVWAGIAAFRRARGRWLLLWLGAAIFGNLFICGEELSWGQQLFFWDTPDAMLQVNDQQETNLHNMSTWFDQKPKLLIMLGTLVGGILIPLARRFRPKLLPARFAIIYPTDGLWLISLLVLLSHAVDKAKKLLSTEFFSRASELNEIYMYYFMLLYLIVLGRQLAAGAEKQL